MSTSSCFPAHGLFRAITVALLIGAASSSVSAQNNPATPNNTDDRRRRGNTEDNGGRRGGNFSPEDMQARMLTSLRERFEVTDDEEWKLISDRIAKIAELRRNSGGGIGAIMGFAGRGGPPGGGSDNRGGSDASRGRGPRTGGSSEIAALQTAVRDKLPDAEIKARLERVRDNRKENEVKLAKAQEELRALLTVRQEAVAVVYGLLP
jgi:hypothetical protein